MHPPDSLVFVKDGFDTELVCDVSSILCSHGFDFCDFFKFISLAFLFAC